MIRVIKHFQKNTGEVVTKSFRIRKQKVLDALWWLQKYNTSYKDIKIDESNLNWMENNHEAELPVETMVDIDKRKMKTKLILDPLLIKLMILMIP